MRIRLPRHAITGLVGIVSLALLIPITRSISPYALGILTLVLMWGAMASSFNILAGYTGQICFIPPIFTGVGAYLSTWLLVRWSISPWLGIFVGAAVATLIALGIGYLFFRYGLRDVYFALGTMAALLIVQIIFVNLPSFGGAQGLYIIIREDAPWMMMFRNKLPYFYIALGVMTLIVSVSYWVSRSKMGYWFRAIRENQEAAEGLGVNVMLYKQFAIAISAFLLAMTGTFWAQYVTYIDPYTAFHWEIAGLIIIIMVAGGSGTVFGPLLGASILVPITELVRGWLGHWRPGVHMVVYGAILMLILLYLPDGFMGVLHQIVHRFASIIRKEPWAGVKEISENSKLVPVSNTAGLGTAEWGPKQLYLSPLGSYSRPSVAQKLEPSEGVAKSGEVILEVSGLTRVFGGLHAVSDLSFSIRNGEVLGIIGPNGAGKTTTFNTLSGFLKPSNGRIVFKGEDITGLLPHKVCEKGLARTFQIAQTFPKLTLLETVMVGTFVRHSKHREAEQRAYEILRMVSMVDKADTLTESLTLADHKRLEIAKALATGPEVVLLDEVVAGLTDVEVAEVVDLLRRINREAGITLVVIEHVMKAIMALCDRIIVLDFGKKIAEGTPEEICSDPRVIEAYLGKVEAIRA